MVKALPEKIIALAIAAGFIGGLALYAGGASEFAFWIFVEAVPLGLLLSGLPAWRQPHGMKAYPAAMLAVVLFLEALSAAHAPNLKQFFELQMLGCIPVAGALSLPFALYRWLTPAAWLAWRKRLVVAAWLAIAAVAGGYALFILNVPRGGG